MAAMRSAWARLRRIVYRTIPGGFGLDMAELYRNVQRNSKLTHDDLLKYSVASQNAAEGKEDARRKPSKRVCALCSTNTRPN
jgi:hypothetical protein